MYKSVQITGDVRQEGGLRRGTLPRFSSSFGLLNLVCKPGVDLKLIKSLGCLCTNTKINISTGGVARKGHLSDPDCYNFINN